MHRTNGIIPLVSLIKAKECSLIGKQVLVRPNLDYSAELDGYQKSAIDHVARQAKPTLELLLDQGARIVLIGHCGQPRGQRNSSLSLEPVAKALEIQLQTPIQFVYGSMGNLIEQKRDQLGNGEILMLENLRFLSEEERNTECLARSLAKHVDIYVMDDLGAAAYPHASVVGIPTKLPRHGLVTAGPRLFKDLQKLSATFNNPTRPFSLVIGGRCTEGKIRLLSRLPQTVDRVIIAGGVALSFLMATNCSSGQHKISPDIVPLVKTAIHSLRTQGVRCYFPIDYYAMSLSTRKLICIPALEIPDQATVLAPGPASVTLFRSALQKTGTLFWCGRLGHDETPEIRESKAATLAMASVASDLYSETIVCGRDTM